MPYWRLSGFYFFYFATLGALVPYWGLYLQSVGFTPVDIGNLMALIMFSRIVAPVVWGWIADHSERRLTVVRLGSALTLIAFAGVFLGHRFWWLALVLLVFSFFWHASLPLLEVFTMSHTGARPGAYGRVRLWGSLGFIVAVVALGPVVDAHGPWWILPTLTALIFGIWMSSLVLPEPRVATRDERTEPFLRVVRRPEILAFLAACLLMQASHGPYYTFYSIYLESYGHSKTLIGMLWAFGVLCEIGIFLWMPRLFARVDLRRVLIASLVLAALRWLLIGGFPENLPILIAAQALHAASFGTFHASAMQFVHRIFTGRHAHRGQAVYGSVSFGIGGAVGSFYSGQTWLPLGATATFALAAGLAAGALVLACFFRPKA